MFAGRAALASAAAADDEALQGDREPAFLRLRERRWLDNALREEGSDIRSSVERVSFCHTTYCALYKEM